MNILFVQRNAQIGGGNTYLRVLAPELRRRGHQTHLMVGPGPMRWALAEAFGTPPATSVPVAGLATLVASRLIRGRGIDVVDAHTFKAALHVLPACERLGVPLVQHIHSLVPLDEAAPALQAAAQVVVMNRAVRDWVAQVPGVGDKTVLSVLPVDAARFAPVASQHEGFHVLYCGRLARRKAAYVSSLLDVFCELAREIPGLRLSVVGGRSHRRQVAERAAQVNRAVGRPAVEVLGEVLDPSQQVAGSDLVIGTGYVVLEALASGRHAVGVGIQGLTGLVSEESFQAAADVNFGDHGAFDREVTPPKLADEVRRGYAAWRESPLAAWGPALISARYSPQCAGDDLEAAFGAAVSGL